MDPGQQRTTRSNAELNSSNLESLVEYCVVVPTRNEAHNVAPLVERLGAVLAGDHARIIFVDDSDDPTPETVALVATTSRIPVQLVHRQPAERDGGLGSAVLAGLHLAAAMGAPWAVVMDGDLQHPPEVVPELVAAGADAGADLVVASRYVGAGSAIGLSGHSRMMVSSGATTLSKVAFRRRLQRCTDPMSGFFAVRLASVDLARLHPHGFKILLEIVARSDRLKITEVPFVFAERLMDQSKASWREGAIFAQQLVTLRMASVLGRQRDRVVAATKFAVVGASGLAVNSLALWLLVTWSSMALLPAAVIATQLSTSWNFGLTDRVVFKGPKFRHTWQRFVGFVVVNNAVLLLRLPLLSWLVHQVGVHFVVANALTLVAAFAARFFVSDLYLFASRRDMSTITRTHKHSKSFQPVAQEPTVTPRRSGPTDLVVDLRHAGPPAPHITSSKLLWRYDIHGLLTVASVVRLRELDHFRADVKGRCDIEIRGGHFGHRPVRARARVPQFASVPAVSYEEHAGRHGSDFLVDMTDNISVTVGPLLIASPHVLYTNVVEALLRFVLVSRGRVLLHSACLEVNGSGLLLSARTDTGKTGTVLRMVREGGARFLSDDMTIVSADGTALAFPKQLTISQHTLRAVDAGDLTPSEWRWLRVQSRLHSKEGRGIGTRLGEMNLPIMSLNALTQFLVPPPKFAIQRLVPCQGATSVTVEQLFIIERDAFRLETVDADHLVDELIDNTDDAYGFPPFRYFAPALEIDGEGYESLRVRERAILAQAMSQVQARRLATPDFSWADHIPSLVDVERHRILDGEN
jgi:putative flippase GtrA